MKTKIFKLLTFFGLLLIFVSLLLIRCDKNNEIFEPEINHLDGIWFLESIESRFFETKKHELGEVKWIFDASEKIVEIKNYVDVHTNYLLPNFYNSETGKYNYGIHKKNKNYVITVQSIEGVITKINKTTLIIDFGVATDGSKFILKKYQTTCEAENPIEDLPWLKEIKESLEKSTSLSKKNIYQYTYNANTVFLVDDCTSNYNDNLQIVYNCSGEKICEFGGIARENTCLDFKEKATNKIILWTDFDRSYTCGEKTIIDKGKYQQIDTSNYIIKDVSINGDCLKITLVDSGCSGDSWDVSLVDSEDIAESDSPQRFVKIELKNEERCLALITKEFLFNISNLKASSTTNIKIQGWNTLIKYTPKN